MSQIWTAVALFFALFPSISPEKRNDTTCVVENPSKSLVSEST
jgi:hypothetical protein